MVLVHQNNKSKILQTLFFHAPISRIEIANITSLAPPTITSNIAGLIDAKLVAECGKTSGQGSDAALGRKPILLDIVNDAAYAIGADWGPNGIICSVTDLRGNVLDKARSPVKKWEVDSVINETSEMIKRLIKANRLQKDKILGVGVGVPGFVEIETGIVRYSPVQGWKNINVGKELEDRIGLPVCVENNVRIMAIGEMLFSGWKNKTCGITGNFLYVFVGEGIACAIVNNNELLQGNISGAGQLGHSIVVRDGTECRCGKLGCLETVASEYGIKKQVAEYMAGKTSAGNTSSVLKKEIKNPNNPSIGEILSAWDKGDKKTAEIINEGIYYLGCSIANVINLINPKLVLVDGQVFSRPDLKTRLRETVREHIFALTDSETEFEFKDYDIDRCSAGGAACAIRHFLFNGGRPGPLA